MEQRVLRYKGQKYVRGTIAGLVVWSHYSEDGWNIPVTLPEVAKALEEKWQAESRKQK